VCDRSGHDLFLVSPGFKNGTLQTFLIGVKYPNPKARSGIIPISEEIDADFHIGKNHEKLKKFSKKKGMTGSVTGGWYFSGKLSRKEDSK